MKFTKEDLQTAISSGFPDFTLKPSKRAKRIRIELSPASGIQITVPDLAEMEPLRAFMEEKKEWLIQHFQKMEEKKEWYGQNDNPPENMHLQAIEETWWIQYKKTETSSVSLRTQEPCTLKICGNIEEKNLIKKVLQKWLILKGKQHLAPWLEAVSKKLHMPYQKSSIKCQKTLWGSCSNKKIINLNAKLLLIPSHLVRYVMVHELSHTVHMDHSPRFWSLVEENEPQYELWEKELNHYEKFVPFWV